MHYSYNINEGIKKARTKAKATLATAAIGLSTLGLAAAMPLMAKAASTVTVTPTNTQGWTSAAPLAETRPGGSVVFTEEFGAPTGFGSGSLKVTTTDSSAKAQYFHPADEGTLLSDVNDISYSTYRSSASTGASNQVAAINVGVDANGDAAGGFTNLVFEPVYNTDQQALANDTWQSWDAGNDATYWSSNPIPGAPNRDTFVTLSQIKAANPDAVVLYYGVNQGSGNPGIVSGVDAFTFGDTTYNFELTNAPTDKDQCKDNGWQSLTDQNGQAFKNQGQCVSYANHHDGVGQDDSHAHNR